MTTITAVIVTHNRVDKLRHAVNAAMHESFDKIIVVDNASNDGTANYLAQISDDRLQVITLPTNTGGAGGFHHGVTATANADWLVLFDDDAHPTPGSIDLFRALTENLETNIGAIAARVDLPDGTPCEMNKPLINPFWGMSKRAWAALRHGRKGFTVDNAQEIDAATFVGFFLNGQVARSMGPPEADLFLYSDDILYSLSMRRAGWHIRYEPDIRFYHDCETLRSGGAYRPLWKNYYTIRNGTFVAKMAAGYLAPVAMIYLLMIWTRRGMSLNGVERRQYFQIFRKAIIDGIRGKRGPISSGCRNSANQ
ncbi:hypothetical protein BVC71_13935 [Marivivens niveibacter]|uniref:Glycosyltransferase 2-like domain-containing protein n=1 Tax=Marivivens niveibacter TaxID=1930667 RepID=A0A251WUV5_9RHOB|nr:glycosyltransferase [Marivivens niveibacter]OUD08269.1 hypothetical protein BVC71_13935 [Marivivens niveibacter]